MMKCLLRDLLFSTSFENETLRVQSNANVVIKHVFCCNSCANAKSEFCICSICTHRQSCIDSCSNTDLCISHAAHEEGYSCQKNCFFHLV